MRLKFRFFAKMYYKSIIMWYSFVLFHISFHCDCDCNVHFFGYLSFKQYLKQVCECAYSSTKMLLIKNMIVVDEYMFVIKIPTANSFQDINFEINHTFTSSKIAKLHDF